MSCAQHPGAQHRHQRAGEHVGGNHREADGERQRDKELSPHARHEQGRDEHGQHTQHRQQPRRDRLLAGIENRARFRHARGQMRMDILDLHGGFVDEDAHRKRQSPERHDIDGLAGHPQADHGGEDRERNRDDDDERAAKIPEENQHHQTGQKRAEKRFPDQPVQGADDVSGLIEDEVDLDVLRRHVPHGGQRPTHVPDDVEGRRIGALRHGNVDGPLVVDVRIADDNVGRVGDRADIPQVHRRTCTHPERRIEQLLNVAAERGVRRRDPNQVAGSDVTRRQHDGRAIQAGHDFVR